MDKYTLSLKSYVLQYQVKENISWFLGFSRLCGLCWLAMTFWNSLSVPSSKVIWPLMMEPTKHSETSPSTNLRRTPWEEPKTKKYLDNGRSLQRQIEKAYSNTCATSSACLCSKNFSLLNVTLLSYADPNSDVTVSAKFHDEAFYWLQYRFQAEQSLWPWLKPPVTNDH